MMSAKRRGGSPPPVHWAYVGVWVGKEGDGEEAPERPTLVLCKSLVLILNIQEFRSSLPIPSLPQSYTL